MTKIMIWLVWSLIAASSRFNAPTPAETQVENFPAGFVNLATLGVANLVTSATTGHDLAGNNLNVTDAFEQTLHAGAFAATLPLDVLTDGESLEAEGALEVELGGEAAAEATTATQQMNLTSQPIQDSCQPKVSRPLPVSE